MTPCRHCAHWREHTAAGVLCGLTGREHRTPERGCRSWERDPGSDDDLPVEGEQRKK